MTGSGCLRNSLRPYRLTCRHDSESPVSRLNPKENIHEKNTSHRCRGRRRSLRPFADRRRSCRALQPRLSLCASRLREERGVGIE
jgi:hypothetical protein